MGYLDDWDLTYEEINELLTDNPSLRSFVSGYAAEMKCRRLWFESDPRVSNVTKYDDHDRTKKGDIAFDYRGHTFTVEVKSLQTNSIKYNRAGDRVANFQCDASDKRPVVFPDGSTVDTTCLLVGEFDLLAVNLHGFYGKWHFAFAKNEDLPRVSGRRGASRFYTQTQLDGLLATSMPMTDPPGSPYEADPWNLLDELVEERERGLGPAPVRVVTEDDGGEVLVIDSD
ncbi:hypothetical protein J1G44_09195 [Cellulomonas sp. zg-ZUI199]|uniref:Restriction endonuclease n=1 Tax=Cellulomonas wangleii TaxID=2816956 RepID=A0ABX8D5W4_9CELL|nr:hypothetical protein [Cellulomonas wangleii]MBO0924659.1 hypothetical protein [Cellulomonas wangleii]QVI62848.1 hypothetical protein KG103_02600 [Cellulomonas wangleii]